VRLLLYMSLAFLFGSLLFYFLVKAAVKNGIKEFILWNGQRIKKTPETDKKGVD